MTYTPPAASVPLDQPDRNISFVDAFKRFWKKGFTFTGRASRREFWLSYLATWGPGFALYILGLLIAAAGSGSGGSLGFSSFFTVVAFLYWLACAIPSIAVSIRRLHDTDKPGAFYLIAFLPFGGLILLILLGQEPNPAGARFDVPGSGYAPAQAYGAPGQIAPGYSPPPPPPGVGHAAAAPSFGAPVPPPPPLAPNFSAAPAPAPAPTFGAPVPPPPAPPAPPVSLPPAPPIPPAPSAAGPISAVPGVTPASAPSTPAFSAAPAAAPFAAPSTAGALDSTRLAAPTTGWSAVLPDGRTIPLTRPLLFGRDPGNNPDYPDAVLVPIDDPAKSMSKTHAAIVVDGDKATVTDLHSTNGTKLAVDGGRTVLAPGIPSAVASSDASVVFGDYAITLRKHG